MRGISALRTIIVSVGLVLALTTSVAADRFSSTSYVIDASVMGNSYGGSSSSTSYNLASSGGESVIGNGSGGSYMIANGYAAQLQNSLQLTVQPSNLVAYYDLNEPSGSFARDTSANNYNATTTNGPVHATGKVGGGLDFTATNQLLTIPVTWTPPSAWTLSFWVYPRTASNYNQSVSTGTTAWTGFTFCTQTGGGLYAGTNIGTRFTPADLGTITLNQWQQYTYVYDNGTAYFYKNGTLVASKAQAASAAWPSLNIGAAFSTGSADGVFDEVKLLSKALSANEVQAEYDAGQAGNQAGLSFASTITPGTSQTSQYDVAVLTDTPQGYNLSVNQNQNLTNGTDVIAGVSGSIASPLAWSEGATKGLGFTLYGTNATAIPGKWSSGNAYAAFPGSATSYYVRTGKQSAKDIINLRLRLDVPTTQVSGPYTNVITTTGTITP